MIVSGALIAFHNKLREKVKFDFFDQEDLKELFPESSPAAIHSGITRGLLSKDIIKLKRGIYIFGENLRKNKISSFAIAGRLYSPSYVSFESALSFHGLIPEAVYVTTSACFQRKKKKFHTPIGDFTYEHIPCKPFFQGVKSHSEKSALIAEPIKALMDLIYFRHKTYEFIADLESDLRISEESLRDEVCRYSFSELEDMAISYPGRNVGRIMQLLLRKYK